jgi:hypothetical protein
VPLENGSGREVISHNIKKEVEAGKTQKQAEAIALSKAKDSGEFGESARSLHRKNLTKDAVLNWASGRYEYSQGEGDNKKPIREVSGV